MKDYYEILKVNRDATKEKIEEAYQKLMEEYKPHKHSNDKARVKYFEEIQEAYLTLSNEDKKYVYDQELLDHAAELVWTLRQLDVKEKRKPVFKFKSENRSKLWTVLASVVVIGIALFIFSTLDDKENVSFKTKKDPFSNIEANAGQVDPEAGKTGPSAKRAVEPASTGRFKSSKANAKSNSGVNPKSLDGYLKAIGSEKLSYNEKASLVGEALNYFEDKNSNVLVIGANNVQTRRETVQNYLDIIMIQGYNVSIVDSKKNKNGKITQISVRESL